MAHWAALISVSLILSQTPAYTTKPRIEGQWLPSCTRLLPSFYWYSLHLPREGGQVELTWATGNISEWSTRQQTVTCPSNNLAAHDWESNSQLLITSLMP